VRVNASSLRLVPDSRANLSTAAGYLWSKLIHVGDQNDWAVFTPRDGSYAATLAQLTWGAGAIGARLALPPAFYQGGVADSRALSLALALALAAAVLMSPVAVGTVYLISTSATSQVGALTRVSTQPRLQLGATLPVSCRTLVLVLTHSRTHSSLPSLAFMVAPPASASASASASVSSKRAPLVNTLSGLVLVGDELFGVYNPFLLFSVNVKTRTSLTPSLPLPLIAASHGSLGVCQARLNVSCTPLIEQFTQVDNLVGDAASQRLYAFVSNVDGEGAPYSCTVTIDARAQPLRPLASRKTPVLGLNMPVLETADTS